MISPRIIYQSDIYFGGKNVKDVFFQGIYPNESYSDPFYDIEGNEMVLTNFLKDEDMVLNNGIISKSFAETINIQVGGVLRTNFYDLNGSQVFVDITITGIFDDEIGRGIEFTTWDQDLIYLNIRALQKYYIPDYSDFVNFISIEFNDETVNHDINDMDFKEKEFQGKEFIENAVLDLKILLNDNYIGLIIYSSRVSAVNNTVDSMGFASVMNVFNILLNLTAVLLIVNIQIISMEDRKKQTGILRALGEKPSSIVQIFIIEAFIVGVVGSLLGLLGGKLLGDFVQSYISDLFLGTSEISTKISLNTITNSIIFGTILSVIIAIIPAVIASKKSITSAIKDIEETKIKKKRHTGIIFGFILVLIGIVVSIQSGQFWIQDGWRTFADHNTYLIGFSCLFGGIGLMLSEFFNKQIGLNITGSVFLGISLFDMFVAVNWLNPGESDFEGWVLVVLLFQLFGLIVLISANYNSILKFINKILSPFKSLRSCSQVTTKYMNGKKSRGLLAFTVLTLILTTIIFVISSAETQRTSLVAAYEERSDNMDIVMNVDFPHPEIQSEIEKIDNVTKVFGFRSNYIPIYFESPHSNNSLYAKDNSFLYRRAIEIPKSLMSNNGLWDKDSFKIHLDSIAMNSSYDSNLYLSKEEK